MLINQRRKLIVLAIFVALFANFNISAASVETSPYVFASATKFCRTELYFGMNKGDEAAITDEDWNAFVEREVTPRFPDGLTIFEAYGQYKSAAGKIIRERSRVVAIFYPKRERAAVNVKVEEIRAAYKKQFAQESVMRLDFIKAVEVSF